MSIKLKTKVVDEESYLRAKNEIVFMATGVVLIPEDQIIKHTITDEHMFVGSRYLSGFNCTYCAIYLDGICKKCPMYIAGNFCDDYDSTYKEAAQAWDSVDDKYEDKLLEIGYTLHKIIVKRR